MSVRTVLMTTTLSGAVFASACSGTTQDVTAPGGLNAGAESPPSREATPQGPTTPAAPGNDRGPAAPSPPEDTWDAAAAQWTVGHSASDQLLEKARVAAGAAVARVLRPKG